MDNVMESVAMITKQKVLADLKQRFAESIPNQILPYTDPLLHILGSVTMLVVFPIIHDLYDTIEIMGNRLDEYEMEEGKATYKANLIEKIAALQQELDTLE